jgi:hypothetical protein
VDRHGSSWICGYCYREESYPNVCVWGGGGLIVVTVPHEDMAKIRIKAWGLAWEAAFVRGSW